MEHQIFLNDYDRTINQIISLRDSTSGSHPIDKNKAEQWINGQLDERRRKAARNLINNTHYITFNELFEDVRDTVIHIYNSLDISDNIFMYIGWKGNSYYFIGIIAMYFIKLFKYKEPICVDTLRENSQIIMFDDCSYTGSQFFKILKENKISNSTIYYGLSCIVDSKRYIS